MKLKKKFISILISFALFVISFPIISTSIAGLPSSVDGVAVPTLADVVERVEDGIVNISTRSTFSNDDMLRRFFRQDNRRRFLPSMNVGSGVVYDAANGYILTNAHVLEDASQIAVTLSDGREAQGKLIGSDPDMDLAVLQVELDNLTEVQLGDSDKLRVGDFVLAIGNNYGLSATVTSGIVSALGRSGLQLPQSQYQEFIQTDASINPGSSGGALVDLKGQVIGINTAIFAPSGGNIGIGFAIPMNNAANVAQQIIEFGHVKRGILGIRFQELSPELAKVFQLDATSGVLISSIEPDSAADQSGMKAGDILTHVDGNEIGDGSHLRTIIALIRIGESVTVRYVRDGVEYEATGIIGERIIAKVSGEELSEVFAGAEFQNTEVAASGEFTGIVVSSVEEYSSAWYSGLREGDFISEVNRNQIQNVEDLRDILSKHVGSVVLKIHRNGRARYMIIG